GVAVDGAAAPPAAVPLPGDAARRKRLGNGRRLLRRQRVLAGTERLARALRREARTGVVDEIIMPGLTIAAVEGAVGQGPEECLDRRDAGLRGIGTADIGAAAIARLRVPIVGAGPRVGILDLVGGWHGWFSVLEIDPDIAGREREVIGARPTHHRLMVVVGE